MKTIFRDDMLAGRVALVTGGGTGICKGIARAFAAHGASVCLVSRKPDVLAAAADEIARETGARVTSAAADVRQPDQIGAAVAACLERHGRLDILVNGAAGNFLAPAAALSPNGFRTVIEIDLVGTFNASKAAFEALGKSGRGLILNISATLQLHGTPLQAHAAAAKAGVDSLTRTLAVEWARLGIRVNAIAPGAIGDTEGMRRLAPGEIGKRMVDQIPLARFGTIDDVAGCALYLASDAAAWITGAVFVVDGGHSVAHAQLVMASGS
ncbi:MAG TPA: SDR family oxidoreductase [Kofleriaceae bacterium]|nr:SDR family oxidoreductase [Kofleriaceae bacterium]